ncbi:MAG: rhodanese-related sulfurtransferase [Bacteroidetes bacterium]|nr:rhodanese-related sulfurtransferase [Bacteroidota bacterium]
MTLLVNRENKDVLKQRLKEENIERKTISFYRYVSINDPQQLRDELFKTWSNWKCFGRIYIAHEGINAQMSVPLEHWDEFVSYVNAISYFKDVPFKHAVDGNGKSFYKLVIKVKEKVVADGISDPDFDPSKTGNYLNAVEFNKALEDPNTIVVDMRNHYESEVGRFDGAFTPDADTFREELPLVIDHLQGQEDKKILMYCTGGIRCEKASAYFKHKGFKDVNHLQGGIIQYAKEVKEQGLDSKFKGINFVFDERIGERITNDVLSECHQCSAPCDTHVNCKNDDCHLLFIQCADCTEKMKGCCTPECVSIIALPIEEQRKLRKGRVKNGPECLAVYKSRLRPNLKEIIKNNLHLK